MDGRAALAMTGLGFALTGVRLAITIKTPRGVKESDLDDDTHIPHLCQGGLS
jgi:hypothetical protein